MALKFKNHPGREYVKVICDICGGQFYQKDTVRITDKYNHQYGLLVCLKDVDERNDQSLPNNVVDITISQPEILRPVKTPTMMTNENDDRAPGAPRLPMAQGNPISDYVDLFWQGPEDAGSSSIVGYKIERAAPQGGSYSVINANTGAEYLYYSDTSADAATDYSYRIAAINSFGTGPYSPEFYWPVKR